MVLTTEIPLYSSGKMKRLTVFACSGIASLWCQPLGDGGIRIPSWRFSSVPGQLELHTKILLKRREEGRRRNEEIDFMKRKYKLMWGKSTPWWGLLSCIYFLSLFRPELHKTENRLGCEAIIDLPCYFSQGSQLNKWPFNALTTNLCFELAYGRQLADPDKSSNIIC